MVRDETARALIEAIDADIRLRVDRIVDRVEDQVDTLAGPRALEAAIHDALVEVTEVVAEGMVARLREVRLARSGPAGSD